MGEPRSNMYKRSGEYWDEQDDLLLHEAGMHERFVRDGAVRD